MNPDNALLNIERAGYVGRYAPSPTGRLHLGNLRTALVAWKRCREFNGLLILRIEDTDTTRGAAGAEESIYNDLQRIGVTFDEGPYRQSDRGAIYEKSLLELARSGFLYPCRCSRKDLQAGASAPHGSDGPIYPGTCRPRDTLHESGWLEDLLVDGKRGTSEIAVRFRTDLQPEISYFDQNVGAVPVNMPAEHGDFVLLRKDGLWAYQLACAVDDALMGITEVARGEDLRSSAARQVAIMQALGFSSPTYYHIPLVESESGEKMSKRDGAEGLDSIGWIDGDVGRVQDFLMGLVARGK